MLFENFPPASNEDDDDWDIESSSNKPPERLESLQNPVEIYSIEDIETI